MLADLHTVSADDYLTNNAFHFQKPQIKLHFAVFAFTSALTPFCDILLIRALFYCADSGYILQLICVDFITSDQIIGSN